MLVLVRGPSLTASMSHYLIEQIAAIDNIEVRTGTQVAAASGDDHLARLTLAGPDGEEEVDAAAMFVFIGAAPYTDWVGDLVGRDPKGFVLAGPDAAASARTTAGRWSATRSCSRRRCPACSSRATSATARSSASRARSARAR